MTTLRQRIAEAGPALTPTERRLARIVLDDPTTIAFSTVADLAREADTSGPSVVRFAAKLAFDGYGDLQEHVRDSLTARLRRPTDRIRVASAASGDDARIHEAKTTLALRLDQCLESTTVEDLHDIARPIAEAEGTVWILCAHTSAAPGVLLASNLGLLRPGVRLLGGPSGPMAPSLAEMDADDVVLAVDFPRYEAAVIGGATAAREAEASVVAITDGPLSPLAAMAEAWIGVDVGAVGPFDSVLPATAVAELLIAEVAGLLRDEAGRRLDRIEALWTEANLFASPA